MKNHMKSAIAGVTIVATGAAALMGGAVEAQAQEGEPTTNTAERARHHKFHKVKHRGVDSLEALGLDAETIKEAHAAGMTLAQTAEANGISRDELVAALADNSMVRIESAVAAGRIDDAQAEKMATAVIEKIEARIDAEPRGDHEKPQRVRGTRVRHRAEVLTDTIGVDVATLREGRAAGMTLTQIAEANGVSRDELVSALVESVSMRIEAAVESGRIDADEAFDKLAAATEKVETSVDAAPGERDHRRGHRGFSMNKKAEG